MNKRPAKAGRGEGGSRTLAWFCVILMLLAVVLINLLGDRFWWTVPVIYGPRWVWGGLLLGILPQLLLRPRKGIGPMLLAGLLFTFGILDVRVGLGRFGSPSGTVLRLLEFNAEGDMGDAGELKRLGDYIGVLQPDLIVMPECSAKMRQGIVTRFPEYAMRDSYSICFLARAEILTFEIRDPKDFWLRSGSGAIVRADVRLRGETIRVGMVHLATPRRALAKYNDSTRVESMRASSQANLDLRDLESQAARFWITDGNTLPTVIAGDFNLPVASAIYQRHWGDLENAFSTAGVGLGTTKVLRLWGIRIDHVLAVNGMKTVRAWTGPDLGSDHLPMIAEIAIPH